MQLDRLFLIIKEMPLQYFKFANKNSMATYGENVPFSEEHLLHLILNQQQCTNTIIL